MYKLNDNNYFNKYLKYKSKYNKIHKISLVGGADLICEEDVIEIEEMIEDLSKYIYTIHIKTLLNSNGTLPLETDAFIRTDIKNYVEPILQKYYNLDSFDKLFKKIEPILNKYWKERQKNSHTGSVGLSLVLKTGDPNYNIRIERDGASGCNSQSWKWKKVLI